MIDESACPAVAIRNPYHLRVGLARAPPQPSISLPLSNLSGRKHLLISDHGDPKLNHRPHEHGSVDSISSCCSLIHYGRSGQNSRTTVVTPVAKHGRDGQHVPGSLGHNLGHSLFRLPCPVCPSPPLFSRGYGCACADGHVDCMGKFLTSMLEKQLRQPLNDHHEVLSVNAWLRHLTSCLSANWGRPGKIPEVAQDSSEEKLRGLGYSYLSATIGSTRMARRAGM